MEIRFKSRLKKEILCTTPIQKKPEANNVYDLPSVEALVRYMHAAAGFLVSSTWLRAMKMEISTHGQD